MTIAVLATITTRTTRREPLKVLDMATSQAQARPASSSAQENGGKGRGRRTSSRLHTKEDIGDETKAISKTTQTRAPRDTDKKRKAAYDEDIGGFQFTRATSKKSKPSNGEEAPIPESTAEVTAQPKSPKRGRPPKPKTNTNKATSVVTEKETGINGSVAEKVPRGRPKRLSTELDVEPEKNRRSTRRRVDEEPSPIEKPRKKGRPNKPKTVEDNGFQSPEPPQAGTSKIALPFADTPIIRRNKEMREERAGKGQRRNSLSMRGRRASSLIESGASNALPHKEVNTSEFYKHIASDGLSEPRRMKQLLTWCATRAIGDKPSGSRSDDDSARLAARVIQEELLQDFANKSELSDWFSREDADPPTVIVKKPNPKNIQNSDKIKELEEQIQRLQNERHALNALLRPPSIPRYDSLAPEPALEEKQKDKPQTPLQDFEPIEASLLNPSQQSLLTSIGLDNLHINDNNHPDQDTPTPFTYPSFISPGTVSSRLSHLITSLAPTLDSLASGIHNLEIYRAAADDVSSRILWICSERLEERDARNILNALEIEGNDQDDEGGGSGGSTDNMYRIRLRQRKQQEDLGLVLGALSRVERR